MTVGKPSLVIIGNSEIAVMAYEYFTHDSSHEVVAFAVDERYITGPSLCGLPVVPLATLASTHPAKGYAVFVAVGDTQLNRVRAGHIAWAREQGYELASYVSSRAFVWHNVRIGPNAFVLEHNVLQPFTEIGEGVTLWSGNHIGHRSVIEDYVFVASHVVVSGYCRIGAYSFVGVNAALAHQVSVAADNFIAMGAAVTRSTDPDRVYQGSPAVAREISAKRFCKVRG